MYAHLFRCMLLCLAQSLVLVDAVGVRTVERGIETHSHTYPHSPSLGAVLKPLRNTQQRSKSFFFFFARAHFRYFPAGST
jgi:hypothetical protein